MCVVLFSYLGLLFPAVGFRYELCGCLNPSHSSVYVRVIGVWSIISYQPVIIYYSY